MDYTVHASLGEKQMEQEYEKKDITELSWEKVIKGEYNILLVKSTKYNKLIDDVRSYLVNEFEKIRS